MITIEIWRIRCTCNGYFATFLTKAFFSLLFYFRLRSLVKASAKFSSSLIIRITRGDDVYDAKKMMEKMMMMIKSGARRLRHFRCPNPVVDRMGKTPIVRNLFPNFLRLANLPCYQDRAGNPKRALVSNLARARSSLLMTMISIFEQIRQPTRSSGRSYLITWSRGSKLPNPPFLASYSI